MFYFIVLPQVFNGLMERPDWEDALKMPIGALPCGSGNALCSALNHRAKLVRICLFSYTQKIHNEKYQLKSYIVKKE